MANLFGKRRGFEKRKNKFEKKGGFKDEMNKEVREKISSYINPDKLPIGMEREKIVGMIEEAMNSGENIVLIQGKTGSGKSVLLSGMLLEALRKSGKKEKILEIQPRRDASLSVSEAVAAVEKMSWGKKGEVGVSTSEISNVNEKSKVSVVTTGVALKYLIEMLVKAEKGEREFSFDGIIVDEFHENTIDYHIIMGILKILKEKGLSPMVVLTSATLDKEKISSYFNIPEQSYACIEGRAYPVQTENYWIEGDKNYISQAAQKVKELIAEEDGEGDILVFMPGVKEINDCIKRIGFHQNFEVLPLHGSLEQGERRKVLFGKKETGKRRVIVSTNIAETSLTLPDIRTVVDSCRKREVVFNPETDIYERKTVLISKDSAAQREGRAGRVQEGRCYRIISDEDFEKMVEHSESEIRKSSLEQVVLRLKGMNLEIDDFPFLEKPREDQIKHAFEVLKSLEALYENGQITEDGKEILKMNLLGPRLAKMVLEAEKREVFEAALIFALFKTHNKNLFSYPREKRREALEKNRDFINPESDWLTELKIFIEAVRNGLFDSIRRKRNQYEQNRNGNFNHWCREHFINKKMLIEVAKDFLALSRKMGRVVDLTELVSKISYFLDSEDEEFRKNIDAILIKTFADKLMYKKSSHGMPEYSFFDGSGKMNISPGSVVFEEVPEFCLAQSITQGSGTYRGEEIVRNYANHVHSLSAESIFENAKHLLEREEKDKIVFDSEKGIWGKKVVYKIKNTSIVINSEMMEVEVPIEKIWEKMVEELSYFGSLEFKYLKENEKRFSEFIKEKGKRFYPVFRFKNLKDWYLYKFKKLKELKGVEIRNMEDLNENAEFFRFDENDFLDPEKKEEYERYYPLEIAGIEVEYKILNSQWHRADLLFDFSDIELDPSFWDKSGLLNYDPNSFKIGYPGKEDETQIKFLLKTPDNVYEYGGNFTKFLSYIDWRIADKIRAEIERREEKECTEDEIFGFYEQIKNEDREILYYKGVFHEYYARPVYHLREVFEGEERKYIFYKEYVSDEKRSEYLWNIMEDNIKRIKNEYDKRMREKELEKEKLNNPFIEFFKGEEKSEEVESGTLGEEIERGFERGNNLKKKEGEEKKFCQLNWRIE